MITVLRDGPFRVAIYVNDHEPAHVHVFASGEAKINLTGPDGVPELVWAMGMTRSEIRSAYRIVSEYRLMLLAKWAEYHG